MLLPTSGHFAAARINNFSMMSWNTGFAVYKGVYTPSEEPVLQCNNSPIDPAGIHTNLPHSQKKTSKTEGGYSVTSTVWAA